MDALVEQRRSKNTVRTADWESTERVSIFVVEIDLASQSMNRSVSLCKLTGRPDTALREAPPREMALYMRSICATERRGPCIFSVTARMITSRREIRSR